MQLHKSLENLSGDRKLELLKRGVITSAQFASLIEKDDPYSIIGPAIVAKDSIPEFIKEWKSKTMDMTDEYRDSIASMQSVDVVSKFDELVYEYPEMKPLVDDYVRASKNASCQKCVDSRYASAAVSLIKKLGTRDELSKALVARFGNGSFAEEENRYDIEWIDPDSLIGLGNDLIQKLSSCLDCAVKHLGRAKILHSEVVNGYPEHSDITLDETTLANKAVEEWVIAYMDCCSEMDMASCETVGDISGIAGVTATDMIELANDIRQQRLLFQENPSFIPEFDTLRLRAKKIQLSLKNK